MTHRISKSRFVAGWQCPKLLWWKVHESGATELQPDKVLRDLFDQGLEVDKRARAEWPDGVLITGGATGPAASGSAEGRDTGAVCDASDSARVDETRETIESGAGTLFGACFEADGAFCVVDVLERSADGWTLIEVKSATEVKEYHIPDVAFQVHVARRAGVNVARAEVMHLNKEYRYPGDAPPLFVREDVTATILPLLEAIGPMIAEQVAMLEGPLPAYEVGPHCWFHNDCAFLDRCWPDDPDHIRNLWNVGPKKTIAWMAQGVHTMRAIPATAKLNDKQKRQMKAQRENRLIVEPGLAEAIRPAIEAKRLGYLDFETVGRALPVWSGLAPWRQAAAQFSYHERQSDGSVTHADFLAEGPDDPNDPPDDPRGPIARAMLAATANADLVVMYTPFEATRIRELAEHLPHLAEPLLELKAKLWDLQPVVANHVYHPAFRGSFSLKYVLNPLVPELSYNDLVIVDGMTASVEIARLLFVSGRIPRHERDKTRRDLLDYCERDTFATVRLVDVLMKLAGAA